MQHVAEWKAKVTILLWNREKHFFSLTIFSLVCHFSDQKCKGKQIRQIKE